MMSSHSSAKHPPASLQEFLREQFPPEGKAQRVSLALAALNEEEKIKLSPEQWRWVAEDADLEDLT
jgi:hypothetical protein